MTTTPAFAPSTILSIALFGLAGVFGRYFLGIACGRFAAISHFPVPTLLINLLGSFFAGALYAAIAHKSFLTPEIRVGLLVGFLGGFTTFSTFSLETLALIESEQHLAATLYAVLSPTLGVATAFVGAAIIRAIL